MNVSFADEIARHREYRASKGLPDAHLCLACDGTGLDEGSGDAWWNQSKCPACGGDGFEPEQPPMTREQYDAQQAEWAGDEA